MRSAETSPCVGITDGSPEWAEWSEWFLRRFGELPWEMKAVVAGTLGSATVPCQWPEYLDPTFERVAADPASQPMPAPRSLVRRDKPKTPRVERAFQTLAETFGKRLRPARADGEAA